MIPYRYLSDSASIKPYLGKTPSGAKYGEELKFKCRFEPKRTRVKTSKGEEFIQSGTVFFNPSNVLRNLTLESTIKVNNKDYIVKEVRPYDDCGSATHIEMVVV